MKNLKKKIVCLILALIFIFGLTFSAYKIFKQIAEYQQGTAFYSELNSYAISPEKNDSTDALREDEPPSSKQEIENLPKVDFNALKDINSDIVGWVYFEGANIDYPVVKGNDDSYYLDHLFNGELNSSGSIFLDSQNNGEFSDRNSIVYGHHMKNGSMFSDITNYKEQSYYDEHTEAFLLTPNKNYRIRLFSGYVTDSEGDAWQISFNNDDEFLKWTNRLIDISRFKCDVLPDVSDRIITFSTCSYEFDDARFVLHGVMDEL